MYVRKFLAWASTAPTSERAPAAAALARALLNRELPKDEEYEGGIALAALADDPSPAVRLAIAREIAHRADAPRQIIVALAADRPDIATPILRHSPALSNADLIDAAIIGAAPAQVAIAGRAVIAASVCAALIEVAEADCLEGLLDNRGASIPPASLTRVFERFPDDARLREALLARSDLEPALRARLVEATASALRDFVVNCGWMAAGRADRVTREAQEKSFVVVVSETANARAQGAVVRHLRESGRLTAALLLRSVLSGDCGLLEAALAELTGVSRDRAAALTANPNGGAFGALYRRAGLADSLLPVFRFALTAIAEGGVQDEFADGGLQRTLVERVIARYEAIDPEQGAPVLALLRRFHAEAARQEAREFSAWLERAEVMAMLDSPEAQEHEKDEAAPLIEISPESEQLVARIGHRAVAQALNLAA